MHFPGYQRHHVQEIAYSSGNSTSRLSGEGLKDLVFKIFIGRLRRRRVYSDINPALLNMVTLKNITLVHYLHLLKQMGLSDSLSENGVSPHNIVILAGKL